MCFDNVFHRVCDTLEELPDSLDETYERIMMGIKKANRRQAYRLLQCLAVAIRPLSVAELAELLAFEFDAAKGGIQKLNADWRWEDHEQATLSACSSLITIVLTDGSPLVQFSHFSVKEFLLSDRLATSTKYISQYHIVLEDANTVIARACLGTLLQDHVDHNDANCVPLARYAAEYWVNHARVENVAPCIRKGMQYIFDPDKPYFLAWVRLHDIDYEFTPDDLQDKRQLQAAPLYYAAFCGFSEIATTLAVETPHYASAIGGGCGTAMHAASCQGHVHVVRSLLQCGVDVDVRGIWNWTPLHTASAWGYVDVVQCLLDHGADANSKRKTRVTPLSLVAMSGHLDIIRVLLDHHTDVNFQDDEGRAPLHRALAYDLNHGNRLQIVGLLLEHGANSNARNIDQKTPLHLVPSSGLEVARILLEHGADPDAEDMEGNTPYMAAWLERRDDIAQLLSEYRSK